MAFPSDSKTQNTLPSYQTAPLNVSPGPQLYVYQGNPNDLYPPAHKRPSTLRRIIRGFFFIAVFFVLWHLVFPVRFGWFRSHKHQDFDMHNNDWEYEIPSDLLLDTCTQGNEWAKDPDDGERFFHIARTSFDVPLSADNVFLLSRGWLSAGLVEIVTSPDQPKDTVTFDVSAEYHRDYILGLAKGCLVSRTGNQQGVGLFTPSWRSGGHPNGREDTMHFFTKVTFPDFSDDASDASVKGFETDVPNTSQYVRDLNSKITFDSIYLKGTNAPIFVNSLSATKGSVSTSNGPITGSFNTSISLSLKTSNSPIKVDVGLLSNSTDPIFVARTSNGNLDARFRLISSTGYGGKFDIATTTSNSPLFVDFHDAPLNSTLSLEARTSNGRAHVALHPTYEGDFDIETSSWFKANLNFLPAADPSGNERHRATLVHGVKKSHVYGTTSWNRDGRANPSSGVVNVHTSNSAVVLDVLGI